MIIYLYGPDSYRRQKKLKELINAYRDKHVSVDMHEVDFNEEEDAWRDARDFLAQPSMFVDSKLLIAHEGGSVTEKKWIDTLKLYLSNPTIFIIISDSGEPKKVLSFLLTKSEKQQQFSELTGRLLEVFVNKEAVSLGVTMSAPGLRAFCEALEQLPERGWRAANELQKFSLIAKKGMITEKDVYAHVPFVSNRAMLMFVRGIAFGKSAWERLTVLEEALLSKNAGAYIFNSLVYQLRGDALLEFASYDIAIKSGALEYEEALTAFGLAR